MIYIFDQVDWILEEHSMTKSRVCRDSIPFIIIIFVCTMSPRHMGSKVELNLRALGQM